MKSNQKVAMKFEIAINKLESFESIYVVKFYKNDVDEERYYKIC